MTIQVIQLKSKWDFRINNTPRKYSADALIYYTCMFLCTITDTYIKFSSKIILNWSRGRDSSGDRPSESVPTYMRRLSWTQFYKSLSLFTDLRMSNVTIKYRESSRHWTLILPTMNLSSLTCFDEKVLYWYPVRFTVSYLVSTSTASAIGVYCHSLYPANLVYRTINFKLSLCRT